MGDDRYITIKVAYDHGPHDERPLSWIAPELTHAQLTMTEDHTSTPNPSRTWAGIVDGPTFKRFADAWHLNDATRARTFDGMNWEVDGQSPIVYVSLYIDFVGDRYDAEARHTHRFSYTAERARYRSRVRMPCRRQTPSQIAWLGVARRKWNGRPTASSPRRFSPRNLQRSSSRASTGGWSTNRLRRLTTRPQETGGDRVTNPVTILLVEDNPDDAALTSLALREGVPATIEVAPDGQQALDYLFSDANDLPRLVLLDLRLPRTDGLEVLRRIREHERTCLTPVVILTSSSAPEDVAAGYRYGANSYVRKPVDFEQFASLVRQIGRYWLVVNEPLSDSQETSNRGF